jgi:RimJ/RimL family protein N-acetyltransferase
LTEADYGCISSTCLVIGVIFVMYLGNIPLKWIKTERLVIRPPRVGDAVLMHRAMKNSFSELKAWMPWAQALASLKDTEVYLAHGERLWGAPPHDGIEQPLQIMDPTEKLYYGATGIKPANLLIPSFETGYWVNIEHANQGFITEAMNALTRYMLVALGAKRVEINCEERNVKSSKVAERLHYTFEAKLQNHRLDATQRHVTASLIYACTDVNQLPPLDCDWE